MDAHAVCSNCITHRTPATGAHPDVSRHVKWKRTHLHWVHILEGPGSNFRLEMHDPDSCASQSSFTQENGAVFWVKRRVVWEMGTAVSEEHEVSIVRIKY
jgi:hypothetical protein